MSAMSASSGLMPLSLISEHKAAQGGPAPVQPLSFAAEKHALVQAPAPPKPTPNGMETSPPLVPVLGPPQPEPQPSLPCGGISDVGEEERSGGAVPEVKPVEPSPPAVAAVPEQQPPAAEPTELPSPTVNSLSEQSPSQSLSQSLPVPNQAAPSAQPSESQHSQPQSVAQQSEVVEKTKPQPEETSQNTEQTTNEEPHMSTEQVKDDSDKGLKSVSQAPQTVESENDQSEQTGTQLSPQKEENETKSDQPSNSQPSNTQPAQTTGRTSKRTKNNASNNEKKSTAVLPATPEPKEPENDDKRTKRKRLPTQVYQSPIPELNIIAKISKIDKTPATDDRLIVFYRNEFLAVRNAEGGFYVCQAMQNVYKSSSKIKIRWLSQVTNTDHYSPDFYDFTEFDCILTNLNLERVEKNKYKLPDVESQRTQSILKRAIDVEKGIAPPEESVTEEHPDGLDLSLYRNEDQLKKKNKSKSNKKKPPPAEAVKKTRESVRRKPTPVSDSKKVNSVATQPKRVGRTGKVEKPVVQRIIAAKKMGRRKVQSNAVTSKTNSAKEATKKKENTRTQAVKRKNNEPPASTVPEKKAKTGASKTRNL